MSKRATEAAMAAYPYLPSELNTFEHKTVNVDGNAHNRGLYSQGYEQAEKDIWGRIEKYLSEQDPRNYATAGFILKNFDEFKQQIMEEEQ